MVKIKILFVSLVLIVSSQSAVAQVLITQNPANPIQFNVEDLFTFSLNSVESHQNVSVTGFIKNNEGLLMELITYEVNIPSGYSRWRISDFVIRKQSINTQHPLSKYLTSTVSLPFGTYELCLILSDLSGDLSSICQNLDLTPLNGVLLLHPPQCEAIESQPIMFSWLPPAPFRGDYPMVYDLKICERLPGQSSIDAISHNPPHHLVTALTMNAYVYPFSAAAFDTSKTYVWQVRPRIPREPFDEQDQKNSSYIGGGDSEVWCFHWKQEEIEPPFATSHVYLKKKEIGSPIYVANVLPVAIENKKVPRKSTFYFYDDEGKELSFKTEVLVKRGDNRFDINLTNQNEFKHKRYYLLKVQDEVGNYLYLKFRYYEK